MNDQHLNQSKDRHWNIFIPHNLLTQPPGSLTGHIDCNEGLICVFGLRTNLQNIDSSSHDVIGYWHGDNRSSFEIRSKSSIQNRAERNGYLKFHLLRENDKLHCVHDKSAQQEELTMCVCMLNPDDILSSYFLSKPKPSEQQHSTNSKYTSPNKESYNAKTIARQTVPDIVGERLGNALYQFQFEARPPAELLLFNKGSPLCTRLPREAACILPRCVMTLLSYLHLFFQSSPHWVRDIVRVPSLFKHLIERCKRSHQVLQLNQEEPFNKFVLYNAYSQYVMESLIGVYVLYYATTHDMCHQLASAILDWADDVASRSNDLIKWLMGAPAGLKLNAQLTSMLGHFFIYHIYLWTGYLSVLRTALPWLLLLASWTGVLGVSFQLCVVKDIVSMLTVHIYCFYVYAARIFHLQVSALSSMWRLFRGKKWNTLRSRVDSAEYNTDQLFVGTLLFTVLLFLLPTTALYYAVFMGLRVITLAFQSVLTRVIRVISLTPVYSLVLYVLRPGWIAGCVEFEAVCLDTPPSNMVLSLKTSQLPISELINLTAPYLDKSTPLSYSWSHFLSCVASGKILYPWMEEGNNGGDDDQAGGEKTKID